METIVVANQKGGIGKTTTATALVSILESKGKKALLIDADQQGNSTDTYKAEVEGAATLYDVLLEEDRISLEEAIQETENGKIAKYFKSFILKLQKKSIKELMKLIKKLKPQIKLLHLQ